MRNIFSKRGRIRTLFSSLWRIGRKRSLGTPAELSVCIRNLRLGVADVLAVREMEPEIPHLRKERNNDFIRPVATHQSHIGSWERVRTEQSIPIMKREL
jgi:hypothetical protein